jgi:hypothetical protein
MKFISPTLHGVLDYLTCGLFLLAPTIFGFTGTYATVCYILGAGYLVVSLITNMPLGAFRLLPFWLHGRLELVSGPVFIISPWLFGFANENPVARNFFVTMGIVFLLVFLCTQWRAQEQHRPVAS